MKTLLLDRDGTINKDLNIILKPDDVELLPSVIEGLALFRDAGFRFIVVTNQAALGRGLDTEENYQACSKRMEDLLAEHDIVLERIYHAPDASNDAPRRKPNIGMWEDIKRDFPDIAPGDCLMVGDKDGDILFGQRIGCATARIASGMYPINVKADYTVANLAELAHLVLKA